MFARCFVIAVFAFVCVLFCHFVFLFICFNLPVFAFFDVFALFVCLRAYACVSLVCACLPVFACVWDFVRVFL